MLVFEDTLKLAKHIGLDVIGAHPSCDVGVNVKGDGLWNPEQDTDNCIGLLMALGITLVPYSNGIELSKDSLETFYEYHEYHGYWGNQDFRDAVVDFSLKII